MNFTHHFNSEGAVIIESAHPRFIATIPAADVDSIRRGESVDIKKIVWMDAEKSAAAIARAMRELGDYAVEVLRG